MTFTMNSFQSLGFSVVWLLVGQAIKKRVLFFQRFCIPAPIIGGFLFALVSLLGHITNIFHFQFNTDLQTYWMLMFFTSIGFNASFSVLKKGGVQVVKFLLCAIGLAVLQNVLAQGIAYVIGFDRRLAILLGSASLTGGFGTAAAFAPVVDPEGNLGALSLAVAIPTCSSILSCLMAGPIVGHIIKKYNFNTTDRENVIVDSTGAIIKESKIITKITPPKKHIFGSFFKGIRHIIDREHVVTEQIKTEVIAHPHRVTDINNSRIEKNSSLDADKLLFSFMLLVIAAGFGIFLTNEINTRFSYMNFPIYIGSMIVAAIIRNVADTTKLFKVYSDELNSVGNISLNLFLSMALISLKLWQLAELAFPVLLTLSLQVLMMYVFARFVTYIVMGRTYDAAVITAGHIGFGFAATPNAMANMGAICEKFGYSELAFFVVPIVGSLFIDLFNVLIIGGTIALL